MVEPILPSRGEPQSRRPVLGYAMVLAAATLFAVNGAVSKVILASGLSSLRLAQVRSTGALVGLAIGLAVATPARLRVRRAELPLLAVFGIGGLALVQWFYFVAIHRLMIGIALLIQYLAPLLVALWARFVYHEHVRRRIWVALALALSGLTLVVGLWNGVELDTLGVAASLGAACSLALYILLAERAVATRDPVSLSAFGFLFAAIPARVAAMCRSDATTSPNGTIVPRTIIHASSAQTGRWTLPRCPSRETRRPTTEPGNDHHG